MINRWYHYNWWTINAYIRILLFLLFPLLSIFNFLGEHFYQKELQLFIEIPEIIRNHSVLWALTKAKAPLMTYFVLSSCITSFVSVAAIGDNRENHKSQIIRVLSFTTRAKKKTGGPEWLFTSTAILLRWCVILY